MPGSVTTRDDPILDKYLIMLIMLVCVGGAYTFSRIG